MLEIIKSSTFDTWLRSFRDRQAKARIEVHIRRLSLGNAGLSRALKDSLFELKVDYGPGYRVYYTFKNQTLVLLLCGGDKTTQQDDIKLASRIAKQWEDQP